MRHMEVTKDFVVPEIGVDVVDIERMKLALERTPKIRQRLFTEREIAYCEKFRFAERHYAGRWAAKEAVTKALGCGLIQWNGIEVVRRPRRAPTVRIFGKIERFANMVGIREEELQISITHSELSAVAICVVRRAEPGAGGNP
jgi:holo-[acyl-carrier protein] synthase